MIGAAVGETGLLDGVWLIVGDNVGDPVGDRVPPPMSRRTDKSRPLEARKVKASTYSASANKFSMVHPACMYIARTPETIGAAMEVPDLAPKYRHKVQNCLTALVHRPVPCSLP
eukprot:scaffold5169_cov172-Amphora_coffeaeformis.AAC.28